MLVALAENGLPLLRPFGSERIHEPWRMCRSSGQLRIHTPQELRTPGDEPPQHGVHEPGGALLTQNSHRIDGRVRSGLGWIARVFDLMGGSDQQGSNAGVDPFRPTEQALDGRRQPQMPPDTAQRDGAHGSALRGRGEWSQCSVRRAAFEHDRTKRARRICERRGAGCPARPLLTRHFGFPREAAR
jgi:hypothetical protein